MVVTLLGSALIVAMVILFAYPHTPAARALHRHLVERPATFLFDFTWKKLGKALLVMLVVPLLMLAGPETLAMFALLGGDAAGIELMIVVAAMSVSGGLNTLWRQVRAAPARLLRLVSQILRRGSRPRAPRRRTRRPRPPKDDSAPGGWAFA